MTRPTIMFVHLGPSIPAWLPTVLRQARLFNLCPIVLIAEYQALAESPLPAELNIDQVALADIGVSDKHREFRRISPLDRKFREGFWTYTSERFFVIETAMTKLALEHVLHAENDVMLYFDHEALEPRLWELYRGVGATFDNDRRCVPGLMYIPSPSAAAGVTDFYLRALRRINQSRAQVSLNDMIVLGALRIQHPEAIDCLPIIPPDYPAELRSTVGHSAAEPNCYWRNFDALGYVFDAAALGQFLGGVDPRNGPGPTAGFVNESCVFDPRLLRPELTGDDEGRRVPIVHTKSGVHRVANLHIHSKRAELFLSSVSPVPV